MARMTKVQGSKNLYLLPTLTGQGTDSYRRGGMEYAAATVPGMKQYIRAQAQKALGKARVHLNQIRTIAKINGIDDGQDWVDLSLYSGRTDYTLILTDTKGGQKGALAIEYGREEYKMEDENGNFRVIPKMAGKFILHKAFGVPGTKGFLRGTGGGEIGS